MRCGGRKSSGTKSMEIAEKRFQAVDESSSTVEIVDSLLRYASEMGASDVHIDPSEDGVEVRVRYDGTLMPVTVLPSELSSTLVGRFKALADLMAYKKDIPQEGSIHALESGLPATVRVSTYPTMFGERVALRFDTAQGRHRSLDALGLGPAVRTALTRAFDQPQGVILMCGPSGSGKTTTLYSCLQHVVNQPVMRTVFTIEDPIERRVRGATQTQINPNSGLTFARALRSMLRQDPDVILVGEIRDIDTARVVMEAGLTGHLVASTVHAGSSVQVFPRLLEMGVEPFVLTTALCGVSSQRLLRRKCTEPDCGKPHVICLRCKGQGYSGNVVVSEWLPMTAGLRDAILCHGDRQLLTEVAKAEGLVTMLDEARQMVANGITTDEEVERVLGSL
ncbi:MAG: GspE/PulE family protein [Planctomycetota bacterium]